MKQLFNLILTLLLSFFVGQTVLAASIDKTISKSGIGKDAVSVSVKDVQTGKVVYKLNDKQPKSPASTLKLITYAASTDTLGKDYEFVTELYKSTNNDLYIKLSGDPFFTSKDLKYFFKQAKLKNIIEPKNIYIDDYIFDDVEWGEGWQWDDDLSPYMPKFSSYNIDNNLLDIVIIPGNEEGVPPEIRTSVFYPVTFMNLVTTDDNTHIVLSRNNNISPDIINLSGTVAKKTIKRIPINNLKRYFVLRCEDAIRANKINYYGKFTQKKTPASNIYSVAQVKHSVHDLTNEILKNSNNLAAETLFKAAGAKYADNTGSLKNSQSMLNAYFEKIGLNPDSIKIIDGSGVSKNNIMTADFMTDFLRKLNNDEFKNSLATAGEGTLERRMLYFQGNLRAKTGTLSDISAIAGYLTGRSGKTYAFDIMINDPKSTPQEKKSLEEYILRDIYSKY